jgi:hypothetical protein
MVLANPRVFLSLAAQATIFLFAVDKALPDSPKFVVLVMF